MSKLLILNSPDSKNKFSIIELKNIEHLEDKMGKPNTSDNISDHDAETQNIGVCYVYASETINNHRMQSVFMEICIKSIGKFKTTTDSISQKEIAKNTGWSLRTVGKYIRELEKEGFVEVYKSNHKSIGTGSFSSYYKPIFKQ